MVPPADPHGGRGSVTRGGYPWSVCTGGQVNSLSDAVARSVILVPICCLLHSPDKQWIKQAATAGRPESRQRSQEKNRRRQVTTSAHSSSADSHARPSCTRCAECMTTRLFSHAKLEERNTTVRTHVRRGCFWCADLCLVSALIWQPRTHPLGGGNTARVWAGIRRPYVGFCRILSSSKTNSAHFNG